MSGSPPEMDNTRIRLARCFSLTFPKLDPSQYATASAETMGDWDSVAQVTLLTVIGEEFSIDIDFEEFEGATSFQELENRLDQVR
jgi:acyl carrier protein